MVTGRDRRVNWKRAINGKGILRMFFGYGIVFLTAYHVSPEPSEVHRWIGICLLAFGASGWGER